MLNANNVEYLLVGGYAVGYYGFPRPTGDLDIWIRSSQTNAKKIVRSLEEFGFNSTDLSAELFMHDKQIVRMGVPPFRLEVMTHIDGVNFDECYSEREVAEFGGVMASLISLKQLKINKEASGRYKDLADLENLP
ncbi:MAG: hypothetical protein R2684_17315 [Pyrinomonadaceae bacterium]